MGSQENLEYRDLEDMTSHRLDLLAGLSIPKISRISSMSSRNISEINFAKQVTSEVLRAIEIDATPHDLFVEMDELKDNIWQEQARWIKFEENLLEGAERWGKPHIASLSFHSVINLRQVIEDQCKLMYFLCKVQPEKQRAHLKLYNTILNMLPGVNVIKITCVIFKLQKKYTWAISMKT
jgi:hypothetical protein